MIMRAKDMVRGTLEPRGGSFCSPYSLDLPFRSLNGSDQDKKKSFYILIFLDCVLTDCS